jgi:hypothetical protein
VSLLFTGLKIILLDMLGKRQFTTVPTRQPTTLAQVELEVLLTLHLTLEWVVVMAIVVQVVLTQEPMEMR